MDAFLNVVSSVDLASKKEFLKCLQKIITDETNEIKAKSKFADVNGYVTYEEDFLDEDSEVYQNVLVDLNALNLNTSPREGISKTWLTLSDQPYSWMSMKGPVINHPQSMLKTPGIQNILDKINTNNNISLNSCLVSFYPSEKISLSLHSDNEASLDQTQPICNLSIGSTRAIDFLRITQNHNEIPQKTINMKSRSLCTMHPGCQPLFKHRIPQGTVAGSRFILSFRCIKTSPTSYKPHTKPTSNASESTTSSTPNIHHNTLPELRTPSSYSNVHATSRPANTTVIFGTSITRRLLCSKLSYGTNKKVINISHSGDTIKNFTSRLVSFHEDPQTVPEVIEKIIFSIGTNDIRFERGINKFRQPLLHLVAKAKELFPGAQIILQSILPIRINKDFTALNFRNFNIMLYDICKKEGCFFLDIFEFFLAFDINSGRWDYNRRLYIDNLHLNHIGLGRLAKAIKDVIKTIYSILVS